MIAYNRMSLSNLGIRNQVQEAFAAGCISDEENKKIGAAHPVNFYTPNYFICVGLFLLTVVIAACSLGLFMLISAGSNDSFTFLLIFFGLLCYGALEYVIHKKRHFRSGVDYALLWMSASLLFAGFYMSVNNMSTSSQCILVLTLSILFTLRFANNIMALITYAALLTFIINVAVQPNRTIQLLMPFIIMAISVATWFFAVRLYKQESCRHYRQCLTAMKVATLTSFYLAGNCFVVRELGSYIFGTSLYAGGISWLFWILTVATPLFYIYKGVQKKDSIFLWTGLALIAATVFTIRYYYHVMPAEWALLLGGIAMISIAYGLIRYLKTPRHGFTSQESSSKHLMEKLNIESLLIAEAFGGATAVKANNDFQFGGGSGGGGGAGGQYQQ